MEWLSSITENGFYEVAVILFLAAIFGALGQVIFTSLFGFLIGLALGFSTIHGFYIAVALTFSSTIIIVKLLSDKKEVDSLHGQIAIGIQGDN